MTIKKAYPMIDERGMFIQSRYPLNLDKKTNEWLIPGQCIDIDVPVKEKGKIAVLNDNKTGWNYEDDNSGTWYNVETKEEIKITNPLQDVSNYTKLVPTDNSVWNEETLSWEIDLELYRTEKEEEITTAFENNIKNGYFFSNALGIDVDCRRSSIKNDEQNVDGLINVINNTEVDVESDESDAEITISYVGYTEEVENVSVSDLTALKLEMQKYFLSLYTKKWMLELQVSEANSVNALKEITWS